MKWTKEEMLSIPNCLSYFRILLIPVFCVVYLRADSLKEFYLAASIILFSGLTDFLDGQIARRCNMITEFGKFIDPLADKLTHIAIAACLSYRFYYMGILLVLLLLKDGYMLLMGAVHLKHGQKLSGAKLYGKVCTASLFVVFLFLLIWPGAPLHVVKILVGVEIAILLITWILYIREFQRMRRLWV
ncbi:MAG: CDP-alcohol phosphatidyltransferase family protein [Lachnospiraceae bacterium]